MGNGEEKSRLRENKEASEMRDGWVPVLEKFKITKFVDTKLFFDSFEYNGWFIFYNDFMNGYFLMTFQIYKNVLESNRANTSVPTQLKKKKKYLCS